MALIAGGELSVVRQVLQTDVDPRSGGTDIDLKNLSQVLNVVPEVLRRSAPLTGIDGYFTGILQNVHSAADDEFSQIGPYAVGETFRLNDYPSAIPDGWDVWLLGASGRRTSGSGSIVGQVSLQPPGNVLGWGRDDAGAGTGLLDSHVFLGAITAIRDLGPQDPCIWDNEPGGTFLRIGMRIPRGGLLNFNSTSDAAVTVDMLFIMGMFPKAMGHDVLQG